MEKSQAKQLLDKVAAGIVSVDEALVQLQVSDFTDIEYAKVDHARAMRQGVGEVIYGEGKTVSQIRGICESLRNAGQERILITRLSKEKAAELSDVPSLDYHELARIGVIGGFPEPDGNGNVAVVSAGTSDHPVAEEASLTAEMLGNKVARIYDVGVAGIHRLLAYANEIARANVIIAVAGMEGALPSVVGGIASCPVIAVPTSVGYGTSFGGVAALLAMLNSCASGISVVNIDNGFGAGYQASMINHVAVAKDDE